MIRLMTIDDYDKIFKLWRSIPGVGLRAIDDTYDGISRFLKRNPSTCFVYEAQGEIEGVILSGHDGRRGFIYHTAVMEKCRREGIGRQLVSAVKDAMKAEQITKIVLVAYADNKQGNSFWESMGFTLRPDLVYRDCSINDDNISI